MCGLAARMCSVRAGSIGTIWRRLVGMTYSDRAARTAEFRSPSVVRHDRSGCSADWRAHRQEQAPPLPTALRRTRSERTPRRPVLSALLASIRTAHQRSDACHVSPQPRRSDACRHIVALPASRFGPSSSRSRPQRSGLLGTFVASRSAVRVLPMTPWLCHLGRHPPMAFQLATCPGRTRLGAVLGATLSMIGGALL